MELILALVVWAPVISFLDALLSFYTHYKSEHNHKKLIDKQHEVHASVLRASDLGSEPGCQGCQK